MAGLCERAGSRNERKEEGHSENQMTEAEQWHPAEIAAAPLMLIIVRNRDE
jgi:hypothetical protein